MKFVMTPIAFSVHTENDSPIFGESVTYVKIDDEAAGPFIMLHQIHPDNKEGESRFELEELKLILEAAQTLMDQQPKTRFVEEQ